MSVRADGRAVHAMHLFQVKTPEESKAPWDYYKQLSKIPGAQAFETMEESGCKIGG